METKQVRVHPTVFLWLHLVPYVFLHYARISPQFSHTPALPPALNQRWHKHTFPTLKRSKDGLSHSRREVEEEQMGKTEGAGGGGRGGDKCNSLVLEKCLLLLMVKK